MDDSVNRRVLLIDHWDDMNSEISKTLQMLMMKMNVVIILTSRYLSDAIKKMNDALNAKHLTVCPASSPLQYDLEKSRVFKVYGTHQYVKCVKSI
jgi:hypothetical protein